ncbi:hypothetical protein [Ensifer sp. 4252]|uniref:hypothetical protein n=1 Tax=Ensifer sp. 4252 TaxID=3373915 RepID=UPI003D1E01A2
MDDQHKRQTALDLGISRAKPVSRVSAKGPSIVSTLPPRVRTDVAVSTPCGPSPETST